MLQLRSNGQNGCIPGQAYPNAFQPPNLAGPQPAAISNALTNDRIARMPRDMDVLAERGSASKNHPGNARYWKIIIETRQRYLALGKEGNESKKKEIAEAVADQVHRYGGYFLRRDKKEGPHWYEVDSKERIEKIQNALREIKNIPEPVRDYAKEQHPVVYDLFLQASKRKAEMIYLRGQKVAAAEELMNVANKRRRSNSFDGDPVGSRASEPLSSGIPGVPETASSNAYMSVSHSKPPHIVSTAPPLPHSLDSQGSTWDPHRSVISSVISPPSFPPYNSSFGPSFASSASSATVVSSGKSLLELSLLKTESGRPDSLDRGFQPTSDGRTSYPELSSSEFKGSQPTSEGRTDYPELCNSEFKGSHVRSDVRNEYLETSRPEFTYQALSNSAAKSPGPLDLVWTPRDSDVLAERGSALNEHKGNIYYWKLIIENRREYVDLGKKGNELAKRNIAEKIAKAIQDQGGSFLKKDGKRAIWCKMDFESSMVKIQIALRESKNIPGPVREYAREMHPEVYALFDMAHNKTTQEGLGASYPASIESSLRLKQPSSQQSLSHRPVGGLQAMGAESLPGTRIPMEKDVLAERGSASNSHKGNEFYWMQVIMSRAKYLELGKEGNEKKKREFAEEVAKQVENNGGRFLTRDKKVSPHWYEMDRKEVIEKIQTALREVKNIPAPVRDFAKKNHKKVYELWQQAQSKRAATAALADTVPPIRTNFGEEELTAVEQLFRLKNDGN